MLYEVITDYFNVENDFIIEVDLTPNRVDGASHYGVARITSYNVCYTKLLRKHEKIEIRKTKLAC